MAHEEKFSISDRLNVAFGNIRVGTEEFHSTKLVSMARAVSCEFINMWLFVFIGVAAATYGGMPGIQPANATNTGPTLDPARIVQISLAFGFAIFVLVSGSAAISGGHLNTAVTFSMIITGNVSILRGLAYMVAQLLGAIIGANIVKDALNGSDVPGTTISYKDWTRIGSQGLAPWASAGNAFGLEIMGTWVLVWTIFATAVDPRGPSQIAPFCIGMAVFIAHLALVPYDGCSINPARTFGSATASGYWDDQWIFWIGPLMGGGLAAAVYAIFFLPTPQQVEAMRAVVAAGADKMEGFGGEGIDYVDVAATIEEDGAAPGDGQKPKMHQLRSLKSVKKPASGNVIVEPSPASAV